MTREAGIQQVYGGGGHVVILGAGASIASTIRDQELNGKRLPSMDNFIDVVGLQDIVSQLPIELRAANFETLYSQIHNSSPDSEFLVAIQERVQLYFGDMQLPDEPTIYDYLVLALREKDVVATFNWDPFLYQAIERNRNFTNDLPDVLFLHGNVAIGYDKIDMLWGPAGYPIEGTDRILEPTKLLFPIEQKNYTDDVFIDGEWSQLKSLMNKDSGAVRATIFGYGAPVSDIEAVSLLNTAWGTSDDRAMEQFEVIDVLDEEILRKRWDGFIHSHHYDVYDSYFNSSLAKNPRRTSESYFSHITPRTIDEAFRANNPIPSNFKTLEELWDWHRPLIEAEEAKSNKEE